MSKDYKAVVIGTSTGGTEALLQILRPLPAHYPAPIIVVQHLHPLQDKAAIIESHDNCKIAIKEAEEKEKLQPGNVYLAPPNYHIMVEENHTIALSIETKVNYARPSIDVLFESAAHVYGSHLIGIILTGANADGAQGLHQINLKGGLTIVQEPETAVAPTLPLAALEMVNVDFMLSPEKIGFLLNRVYHYEW